MVSSQFYLESVAAHPESYMILCHLSLREVSSELVEIYIYIYNILCNILNLLNAANRKCSRLYRQALDLHGI